MTMKKQSLGRNRIEIIPFVSPLTGHRQSNNALTNKLKKNMAVVFEWPSR